MKKLKLVIVLAFCFLAGERAYCQQPTIEQTIKYIKTQMTYYSSGYNPFFSISDKGFYDPFELYVSVAYLKEDIYVDFSKITSVNIEIGKENYKVIKITGDFPLYNYNYEAKVENYTQRESKKKYIRQQAYTYLLLSQSTNFEGLKKAFLHAAKLNGAELTNDDLFKN